MKKIGFAVGLMSQYISEASEHFNTFGKIILSPLAVVYFIFGFIFGFIITVLFIKL